MTRTMRILADVGKPLVVISTLFLTVLIVIAILTYRNYVSDLSNRERIMSFNNKGVILLDRHDIPFFTFYQGKPPSNLSLNQISGDMKNALIAIEDKDFYHHPGFSLKAIFRSLLLNFREKQNAYGGSTITQQLVKNSLLTPQKNWLRKYQEIFLAYELEKKYSKNDILYMYLNTVYFGEGAYGIGDAAETYFSKTADQLNLAESCFLAGILPAPSLLSPFTGDIKAAKDRQRLVLQLMEEQGYIDQRQRIQAEKTKLEFRKKENALNTFAPHFALMVRDWLINRYGENYLDKSGMQVKTTLDLEWQKYAETAVRNQIEKLQADNVSNGAAVAIDPKNGEIRSLVGSVDWNNDQFGKFNIITSSRQPGSSFKPIVYSAAIERKLITPATILHDQPTVFEGRYSPKDFDGKYRGMVTVRRALANSLNIPAVEVIEKVGLTSALDKAKQFGLTTLKDSSNYGPSLVLGAGEVKPLELTAAYSAFAAGGIIHQPRLITEIKDKYGKVIYQSSDQAKQVISPSTSYLISSILSDNKIRAEEFGNALNVSRQAAVKTGTTENFRDAWTIGYTPNIAVGVWVGNNDGTLMDFIAGSLGATPIWRQLMERYFQDLPDEQFIKPEEIILAASCSGQEYFIQGTETLAGNCLAKKDDSVPPDNQNISAMPLPTLYSPPEKLYIPNQDRGHNKKLR